MSEEKRTSDYTITDHIVDLDTLMLLDKRAMKDLENSKHEISKEEVLTIIREFIRLKNDFNEQKNELEKLKFQYQARKDRTNVEIERKQKEIDILQTKIKQNENIEKIKMCMTNNMPNNVELVCMAKEDFERNFGNDYIDKNKIKEKLKKLETNGIDGKISFSEYYYKTELLTELLGEKHGKNNL